MARLLVVSHKICWESEASPSGYATTGGFPFQMRALAELFDETAVLAPIDRNAHREGEIALEGHRLSVIPLTVPEGRDFRRKVALPAWLVRNGLRLTREILRADAVHTPIPGDLGTFGLLLALLLRKPLLVRHCGNWEARRTWAEIFWRWIMERTAGGRNVMLATGGADAPPSPRNPNIGWIFSTTMTEKELAECGARNRTQPGRNPRLIIVSRQEQSKGTEQLIRSLPNLLVDFPALALDVVGDGQALSEFRQLAENLGVSEAVVFHGQRSHEQVIDLLRQADLFCLPTQSEGFPKAVLEAMACGLPVITTPVSVLPQLVGSDAGVLLPEITPPAISQAVRKCLGDSALYAEMSRAALGRARQYSLENWGRAIGDRLRRSNFPLRTHG